MRLRGQVPLLAKRDHRYVEEHRVDQGARRPKDQEKRRLLIDSAMTAQERRQSEGLARPPSGRGKQLQKLIYFELTL
jgi:hypothetical protein